MCRHWLYRQHPWFTLHLPRYLAVMQADTVANTAMLDEDIVHEVVKLGFKRSDVVKSIQKRSQNKVDWLPTRPVVDAFCQCLLSCWQ